MEVSLTAEMSFCINLKTLNVGNHQVKQRESLIAEYSQSLVVGIFTLGNILCGNNVHDVLKYGRK